MGKKSTSFSIDAEILDHLIQEAELEKRNISEIANERLKVSIKEYKNIYSGVKE